MSTRPGSAPPIAAGQSQPNRLKLVLQVGHEKKTTENTSVALVPTAPGGTPGQVFIPTPLPSMPDPGKLWRDQGLPVPGIYEDRKSFAPEVYKALSKDYIVDTDAYDNKLVYSLKEGSDMVLKKMVTGAFSNAPGGAYFDGPSGKEHVTHWFPLDSWTKYSDTARDNLMYDKVTGDSAAGDRFPEEIESRMTQQNAQYIKFSGTERGSQTIEMFSLSIWNVNKLTDDMAPTLDGTSARETLMKTERGLQHAFAEFQAIKDATEETDFFYHGFGPLSTKVTYSPETGLEIEDFGAWWREEPLQGHTCKYFPDAVSGGYFTSAQPLAIFQHGDDIAVYTREAYTNDIVFNERMSTVKLDARTYPARIKYKSPEEYKEEADKAKAEADAQYQAGVEWRRQAVPYAIIAGMLAVVLASIHIAEDSLKRVDREIDTKEAEVEKQARTNYRWPRDTDPDVINKQKASLDNAARRLEDRINRLYSERNRLRIKTALWAGVVAVAVEMTTRIVQELWAD